LIGTCGLSTSLFSREKTLPPTKKDNNQRVRKNNPDMTKESILIAATEEFSNCGLSGARVDAIAARTRTAKRMIYYYFGSKEELFNAVLERAYSCIRAAERGLNLDRLAPIEAIRRLVEFTFDYEEANIDFIRLVTIENIHRGEHIEKSEMIKDLNIPIIDELKSIVDRGQKDGVFRNDIDSLDLHYLISSFCFFRVSNQYTLRAIFKRDMLDPEVRITHKQMLVDAVLGFLTKR
jgi:AcrR family transcriptional regulator